MKGRLLVFATALALTGAIFNYWQLRQLERPADSTRAPILTRVLAAKKLRAAYLVELPYLKKDTATGKISGVTADIAEEMSKRLGLTLEWTEEANLATLSEGFRTSRYDIVAFNLWRNSGRAKAVVFSQPLFYTLVGAYARFDDHRFDKRLAAINSPSIRIATMDGELAEEIARLDYPEAVRASLPQLSDYNQLLLEVTTKKSDVTFFSRTGAKRFMAENPHEIREVPTSQPIRVFAECFVLPQGDPDFAAMINAAILELLENGVVDQAFISHGEDPNNYFRPALPYRLP